MENKFCYTNNEGKVKGFFNIYQGSAGAIYMQMNDRAVRLTREQIEHLCIDIYRLKDFDHDQYNFAYRILTNPL